MDVGDWLRSLGLSEYEPAFRDNQIDSEVLRKLTGDDLKELGVASVGHRRKLLSAIAELSGTLAEPAAVAKVIRVDPLVHAAAERRQLTVMFCDLVGSTAMSARLDPEDIREMIAAYHQCCASIIERGGGFVAKYMGDGVLGYFGYPQAHEHDAERAVRAGLAIVEAAPTLQTVAGVPLHVRVGIATGIVIVGDLLGSGEAQEREVVGGTPNLAARLQGIAEPDSVVIAEGTRKLLGELFELVDLGPQKLKGIAGTTLAFAALRESSQANRFEALHPDGLAALVGREAECELLLRRWAKAKGGEGQVVLISGEAGIGKSRLTAEFLERLPGEPHTRLRYFCSPQHTDSALYPIIGHIERAANFAREDDAKTRLDKLEVVLSRSSMSGEDAALLAEMLSLPNDGRYPALDLAPHQRRQRTLAALARRIEGIARETPVLMIYEDAHWADPSSLEAIGLLVDKIEALRLLLFVTFRPEFVPPWAGRPHVTALTINRLAPREVTALIDRVAGDKPLAANIRQDIVERADGIPLFVEEMTKAVLEAEGEGAAARMVAAAPSPALAVPASLHASLMARLDRLGPAKGVAQIGAAIGREFSHALLVSVTRETEPELAASLDRLLQSGLLSREGTPIADVRRRLERAESGRDGHLHPAMPNFADICTATLGVTSRQARYDANTTKPLLQACVAICHSCGDECERHAPHHEHCRVCEQACRRSPRAGLPGTPGCPEIGARPFCRRQRTHRLTDTRSSSTRYLAADPWHDLGGDQLDLAALVAYWPEVDALAACSGVSGQQLRAFVRRADADPAAKLRRVLFDQRTDNPGQDPFGI